jgi:hypothetical protein
VRREVFVGDRNVEIQVGGHVSSRLKRTTCCVTPNDRAQRRLLGHPLERLVGRLPACSRVHRVEKAAVESYVGTPKNSQNQSLDRSWNSSLEKLKACYLFRDRRRRAFGVSVRTFAHIMPNSKIITLLGRRFEY